MADRKLIATVAGGGVGYLEGDIIYSPILQYVAQNFVEVDQYYSLQLLLENVARFATAGVRGALALYASNKELIRRTRENKKLDES